MTLLLTCSDYCLLVDYESKGLENNCHELVAYVFLKALEDLQTRFGANVVSLLILLVK